METKDELCEDISNEKSSFRSPRVPHLNWLEDVLSRADEYCPTEPSDREVQEVKASLDSSPRRRNKSSLLELFSVKFVEFEKLDASQIYGFILLRTGNPLYYIFKRVRGDPLPIDSKGFVILEGPKLHALSILIDVVLDPFLFKYEKFEFIGDDTPDTLIWDEDHDRDCLLDHVLPKIVESQFGPLELKYIVYADGVEAHIKVVLTECCFSSIKVHGKIKAENSVISGAGVSSMIFYREEDRAIEVHFRSGEETILPLHRSIIAHPYDAVLTVNIDIKLQDNWIIHKPFVFDSLSHGVNRKSMCGRGCSVQVVVDYANNVIYY